MDRQYLIACTHRARRDSPSLFGPRRPRQPESPCKSDRGRYELPHRTMTNHWSSDREQPESPRSLVPPRLAARFARARGRAARIRGASRLAPLAVVLTSSGRRRATGPFHSRPCRLIRQSERVGMKGATRSTKADEASTAGASATSDEARSEAPESNASPLSGCWRLLFRSLLQGLSGCWWWSLSSCSLSGLALSVVSRASDG